MKTIDNLFNKMSEIPISNVHPQGWLQDYLTRQKNGITGNLDRIGYPFKIVSWAQADIDTTSMNTNPGWWVYEQTAYLLDGIARCGALMQDEEFIAKAKKSFDHVLANADEDGYLGPKFLREVDGVWGHNRWSHVVFFRALLAEYSRTGDQSIIDAICKHYLDCPVDYSCKRDVLNVEIILLAYIYSGKKELLDLAIKSYNDYNERYSAWYGNEEARNEPGWTDEEYSTKAFMSDKPIHGHGVTFNEFSKLGPMLYMCTGDEEYLKPVLHSYAKVDKYQMLPDGLHSCAEFLLDNDHMRTHEMCDVTDYTWTLGYLLMATGDGVWADKIEKCIFNAGFGAIDDNVRSLQYLSGLNQVICTSNSNHNDFFKGQNWMSYRPLPDVECCPANMNRFLPNYCARMWMQKGEQLFANLYGPATVDFDVSGKNVTVKQETKYPFGDTITFTISAAEAVDFALNLRIPAWCDNATVTVNGKDMAIETEKGYAKIARTFNDGDVVTLTVPSSIKILDHEGGGTYVQKGPLLYSLAVEAKEELITNEWKTTEEFPAFNLYPASDWNYAICADTDFEFEDTASGTDSPWVSTECPFSIKVKARKIKDWDLERTNTVYWFNNTNRLPNKYFQWRRNYLRGDFAFTPRIPDDEYIKNNLAEKVETIKLVPMGSTRLRLTLFPKAK